MNTLVIIGKRWFEKTNGNTYHSVEVYIDGALEYALPFDYGYGSMYMQNAFTWLKNNKKLPHLKEYEHLREYCERKKVTFQDICVDVPRRKDLFNAGKEMKGASDAQY